MPSNVGTQTITNLFYSDLTSINVNRIAKDVRKLGIYSGGYLTKIGDTSVSLSPFVAEIGDGTYQVRCQTAETVTVTVASATPYIVLRWVYTGSSTNDFVDFVAVALGDIQTTDIVVGKCNYTGATLSSFSYSNRTNPKIMDLFLKVEPTETASMYLRVRGGNINYGATNYDIADQLTSVFTAPVSNSRIDLVQITEAGAITITTGTPAASPTAPDYGGLVTLAEVTITAGQTTITSSSIKDVRNFNAGIVARSYVDGKFNTSTGHDHDGSDSKKISSTGISGVLGSWTDRTATYPTSNETASTDGFIVGYASTGNSVEVKIYVNDVLRVWCMNDSALTTGHINAFCCPVGKGETWRISGTPMGVYWKSLGS